MSSIYDSSNIGIDRDGNVYCPDCSEKMTDDDFSFTTYWEGSDIQCSECNKTIESEYGDPEEN